MAAEVIDNWGIVPRAKLRYCGPTEPRNATSLSRETAMLFALVLLFFIGLLLASLTAAYVLIEDDFWIFRRPIIFGRDRTDDRP
jgi:hypothetical protein